MKRLLHSSLLVFFTLLLAFGISGCGSSQTGADGEQAAVTENEQSVDDQGADAEGKETTTASSEADEDDETDKEDTSDALDEGDEQSSEHSQDSADEHAKNRSGADSGSNAAANAKQKDAKKSSAAKANENKSSEKSGAKGTSNPSASKKASPKAPKKEQQPQAKTITYSIVADKDMGTILPATEVEVQDGDTVLDALISVTRNKGIHMAFRGGTGANAYVEGINNLYEFDRGQGSGWMYRVNGIFPNRGAGVVPVLPGDRVEWLYTLDLGKDLGADLKPFR